MSEIDVKIKLQGAKIRSLIDAKQPGEVIAAEVKELGDLKSAFAAVTGLAWKPGMTSAAVTAGQKESENVVKKKKSNLEPAVSSYPSASVVVGPLDNIDRVYTEKDCLPTDGTGTSDPGQESGNGEVNTLVETIAAMFPDTPMDYIKARCGNLVGNPAAIEKLTDELLANPTPRGDADGERKLQKPVRGTAIETVSMDKPSSSGGGRLEGDEALAWAWETEQRHHQLMSMFPSLSSDWLLLQVQLTIVQSREAAGSSKSSLETLFQDKINELLNMNSDVWQGLLLVLRRTCSRNSIANPTK